MKKFFQKLKKTCGYAWHPESKIGNPGPEQEPVPNSDLGPLFQNLPSFMHISAKFWRIWDICFHFPQNLRQFLRILKFISNIFLKNKQNL